MEDFQFLVEKLKREIERSEIKPEFKEIGKVLKFYDGVCWIDGLFSAKLNEVLYIEKNDKVIELLALNLEEGLIGALALNNQDSIKEGDVVKSSKRVISVPVSDGLIGRVINPLGKPLDDKGEIFSSTFYPVEKDAPSVLDREPVKTPVHTGIKIIDALIPIGRGQRELILGDRQTGKTSLALDIILNQKNDHLRTPICIYVAIGQKLSKVRRIYEILNKNQALDYTILVVASADDPAVLVYLAPYVGCAIGEYFMDKGEDVIVIYDDLTKHAWAWREINLLLKRPVAREAYPGDIFYLHSRLLERSAKIKGGGSLTALPICETQLGDISGYIPTNLISITDGQIYLEADLFKANFRPAINIGLSVSRVGSKAQTKAMKKVSGRLKLDLAQFRELEVFAQVTTELPEDSRKIIKRGKILLEILKQKDLEPVSFEKTIVLLFAVNKGFFDNLEIEKINIIVDKLMKYFDLNSLDTLEKIINKMDLDEELENELISKLNYFFENLDV